VSATSLQEGKLVQSLRDGDEQAFAALIEEHGASMLRVARLYVRERAVAEEVVQEAWLGPSVASSASKNARHSRPGSSRS
jgi:RNA polymerase sigma-70 factor (ECF subfamily)